MKYLYLELVLLFSSKTSCKAQYRGMLGGITMKKEYINKQEMLCFEELEQVEELVDAKGWGIVTGLGICGVIVIYGAIAT